MASCFFQCIILSFLLIRLIQKLVPYIPQAHLLGLLVLTSLATIAGWYASQLMPDIFTGILALTLILYLWFEDSRKINWLLLAIMLLSILVHNSNYIIATLFGAVMLIVSFLNKDFSLLRKRSLTILAVTVFAWVLLFSSNAYSGKGFTASPSSHVFLVGKLAESGVLKTYLEKACPIKDYKICAYKDELPPVAWAFVWDENSPLYKTGGWESNREEYNTIIKAIISRPKYMPFLAFKSLEATARQLTLINIDEIYLNPHFTYDASSPPYQNIEKYFPHELNEFKSSKQNWKSFNIPFYNVSFALILLISSVFVLMFLPKTMKKEAIILYSFVFLFLVLNAFASATFANVLTRLSSRVIWLLPFVNLIFTYKIIVHYRKRLNSFIK